MTSEICAPPNDGEDNVYTDSALIEKIKKELVTTKFDAEKYRQEIKKHSKNGGESSSKYYDYDADLDFASEPKIFDDRKYYYRAQHYLKIGLFKENIPLAKISLSDLSLESLKALSSIEPAEREHVAKQAYGRIFEDVNSEIYHNSISSILQVKFIDGHDYDKQYTISKDNDKNTTDNKKIIINKILSEQEHIKDLNESENNSNKSISISLVAEALRAKEGEIKVNGTIVSVTSLFKMISAYHTKCNECLYENNLHLDKPEFNHRTLKCSKCDSKSLSINLEYVNTVKITLQDINNYNETDQLSVLLFEEDTVNIIVGEQVIIVGYIRIVQDKTHGKLYPVLYSHNIEYQNKTTNSLSDLDIKAIERFTRNIGSCTVIDKLAEMAFPHVIGNDLPKKGLLLSLVSAGRDVVGKRKRIHILTIGKPGVGKSTLVRSAIKLDPNGRYESGQHSSGKGLTAVIVKEDNETHVLRLGAVSLANDSICGINEIGRMNPEDQGFLLDVMEEGEFSINKYGINARVKASSTILATANPKQNYNVEYETFNLDNVPAIKELIDRFDLIFVFSNLKDENHLRDYANKKSELEDKKLPDYSNYIKKHIMYSKKFNPKFTPEAKSILNEYFIEISKMRSPIITPRRMDSLYRIASTLARIKLKDVVDETDAKETLEFYNVMISRFLEAVKIPENPRDLAVRICIEILKHHKSNGISLSELINKAEQENQQIRDYIGNNLRMDSNFKLRAVYGLLIDNSNIKIIQEKPVVLKYIEELEFFSV